MSVAHAAVRACMGSAEGHARTLQGLVSPADADVRIAQIYLHHRPIADVGELRAVTAAIARMNGSEAQVRALDALAQHYLSDRESLDMLAQLYSRTPIMARPERDRGRTDPRRHQVDRQPGARCARCASTAASPRSGDNMVDALDPVGCNCPEHAGRRPGELALRYICAANALSMCNTGRIAPRPAASSCPAHAPVPVRLQQTGRPRRVRRRRVLVRCERRSKDGVHDHRQFARREGDFPAASAARRIPVRRAGRARPAGLAGLRLPAARFAATRSSFPAISTAAPSSIPIASTPASTCRSRRWSALRAATPVPACFRSSRKSICSAATP